MLTEQELLRGKSETGDKPGGECLCPQPPPSPLLLLGTKGLTFVGG